MKPDLRTDATDAWREATGEDDVYCEALLEADEADAWGEGQAACTITVCHLIGCEIEERGTRMFLDRDRCMKIFGHDAVLRIETAAENKENDQ